MADRYWVGGTASWDATAGTKWATTSGGAGGAAVPTSADNVFFDAASGAVTVTVAAVANCLNLNFTGFTGTLAGSSPINIYGSFVAVAAMSYTHNGQLYFSSTTSGNTITTNGKTLSSPITLIGTGGSWTLQDALTTTSIAGVSLSTGTLTTNNNSVTTPTFNISGTSTRTLNLGSSLITVNGASGWAALTTTGLTLNPGTSTIRLTNAASTVFQSGAGKTYYNLEIQTGATGASGGGITFSADTCIFNNFSINPTTGWLAFSVQGTGFTVNGTFSATTASPTYRNFITTANQGTAKTITAAAVSVTNTDFSYITGAGAAAPWNLSASYVGNCFGNSGITFPTAVNRYAVAAGNFSATSTWSTSSGGAAGASAPLPQDTAILDAASGAGTYTCDFVRMGSINCTGFTRTLSMSGNSVYGNSFTLSSGMTFSTSGNIVLYSSGTAAYDFSTQSFTSSVFFQPATTSTTVNINSQLTGNLSVNFYPIFGVTGCTFNTNNNNILTGGLELGSSLTSSTFNLGSSSITLGALNSSFAAYSGSTINAGTSVISFTSTGAGARTFAGADKTYYNLVIGGATGASTTNINGSNTFNVISSTKTVAHTVNFGVGTTNTVSNFTISGTAGNLLTLKSTSTGVSASLAKSGGGTITVDYASIRDIAASPASTWYATNSTDGGGNTGWTFGAPATSKNLFFGSNF